MKREQEFAKILQSVVGQAKDNGNCIAKEAVEEAFSSQNLNAEQMELVYDYLKKQKIGIGAPMDLNDCLSSEDKNYLEQYLAEIASLPSVSPGEKEAVTLSAMAGDLDAQKKLTEIYLPQVIDIAKLYAGQGVLIEDLIGEGNLAIALGAAQLGCLEHPSEAEGMIARLMMDAMEDHIAETIRAGDLDRKIAERVNAVLDKAKELAEDLNRKVTPGELAEETGMGLEEILEAVRISGDTIAYIDARG